MIRSTALARWLRGALSVLACVVLTRVASAQSCHSDPRAAAPTESAGVSVGAGLSLVRFDTQTLSGHYESLLLDARWRHEWLTAGAAWAGYRILHTGSLDVGPGDPSLTARADLLELLKPEPRASESAEQVRAGLGLTLSLPVGERDKELGMGHAMLTPEVWGEWAQQVVRFWAAVAYSRALGGGEHGSHHGHHMSSGPIVDPMTTSELTFELRAGVRVVEGLWVQARNVTALPTDAGEGARSFAALSAALPFGSSVGAVELAAPLAGDAFEWRVGTSLSVGF